MSDSTHSTTATPPETGARTGGVYVYGIVPASEAAAWTSGDSGDVRAVIAGELAALVSDLPPGHTPGRREDLEAHRRVLSEAIARTTTIPMRFGIVIDDDNSVRERLLEQHSREIGDLIHRLDGHVQMTVKAFYAEDALLREVLAENDELRERAAQVNALPEAQSRAARVQLGEAIAGVVDARRADVEAALLDRLRPYAEQIIVDPASSERVAIQAQLLVRRERRPELDALVRELSETLDGVLAFRYVGPLPPFSFSDLALENHDE